MAFTLAAVLILALGKLITFSCLDPILAGSSTEATFKTFKKYMQKTSTFGILHLGLAR
jgi:hypothetical protein